ncbi:protein kinase [Archangium violaceum]|uniref:protein kinase domain-containing protein n=1 Tax=Archangium violaceum TaxID=83451 RepID=UPI00194F9108|nr:protein kinase [Archangium violaceum]QRN97419.1 protein kinase [Archangium violaceum]
MSGPAKEPQTLSSPNIDLHFGERIGRYQVLAQLSVGGMAELFLGFTSGPGGFRKYVALKRILPDARSNEQFEKMFLDEARITAALNHANIGQVFELGQDEEGLFLAMEFIAGQNLNQISSVCRRRGVALPAGFSLSVVRDVCLALHSAHTFTTPSGKPYPVIHRDVAQKNVMVAYDGVVKLLDFGIAKARDGASRTQVGMVKGTAGYMSPEQVRCEPLDGRSDLFAVGVMLHELLTGRRLFAGESERQEMEMILDAPIPVPTALVPAIPSEVSTAVLKALARKREERYANGREMARAIEAAAGPLLFDAEQRAAFMREHFQDRMEVTRRLLESADEASAQVDTGTARMLGGAVEVGTGGEPAEPSPARAERQPAARERSKQPVQGRRREEVGREPGDTARLEAPAAGTRAVATTGRRVMRATKEEEGPKEPVAAKEQGATEPQGKAGAGRFWGAILVLLVVGGGLGFGAVKVVAMMKEQEATGAPAVFVGDPSPMTPIQLEGGDRKAGGAESSAGASAQADAKPQAETKDGKETPAAAKKDGDGESPRSVKQGALTLVILPEAEVFLNGRSLGKTPLFKVPVPVGKHLLLIKGADKKKRELSVPIEVGKTAQFKLALTDIPEK